MTTTTYKDQGRDGSVYLFDGGELVIMHRHTDTIILLEGDALRGTRAVGELLEAMHSGDWSPREGTVYSRRLPTEPYSNGGETIDLSDGTRIARYVGGELTLYPGDVSLGSLL